MSQVTTFPSLEIKNGHYFVVRMRLQLIYYTCKLRDFFLENDLCYCILFESNL